MPSLLTPRMRFLHLPKTGGTWVRGALEAGGVPCQRLSTRFGGGRLGHAALEDTIAYADMFTLAFVRHPLDCYRSMWATATRAGWPNPAKLFAVRSDDFVQFMNGVLEHHPGWLSEQFPRFTGPPEAPISFVGRFESLVDDLVQALREAGEEFDEAALRAHPKANTSDYQRTPAVYDRPLAERVVESEQKAISRWYADDPLPERLLNGADAGG